MREATQTAQQALASVRVNKEVDMEVQQADWRGRLESRLALGFEEKREPGRCQRISRCLRLGPWQASFIPHQGPHELLPFFASGMLGLVISATCSEEMKYKQLKMRFSRGNKLREKCSSPTDTSMSSSGSGFTC